VKEFENLSVILQVELYENGVNHSLDHFQFEKSSKVFEEPVLIEVGGRNDTPEEDVAEAEDFFYDSCEGAADQGGLRSEDDANSFSQLLVFNDYSNLLRIDVEQNVSEAPE